MKLNKKLNTIIICAIAVLGMAATGFATEEVSKWDTAGAKVKDASQAVAEASAESADKAVEEARLAWEEAKKNSQETLDAAKKKYDEELAKAKASIHAATAPNESAEEQEPSEKTAE